MVHDADIIPTRVSQEYRWDPPSSIKCLFLPTPSLLNSSWDVPYVSTLNLEVDRLETTTKTDMKRWDSSTHSSTPYISLLFFLLLLYGRSEFLTCRTDHFDLFCGWRTLTWFGINDPRLFVPTKPLPIHSHPHLPKPDYYFHPKNLHLLGPSTHLNSLVGPL